MPARIRRDGCSGWILIRGVDMPQYLIACVGIEQAVRHARTKRRTRVFVELIITAALAVSTAIALTAVSIGIARAALLMQ
jgi:hypothetical protein